jgi:hypothetical protein
MKTHNNKWITIGIRNSCKHKRELYLLSRNSSDALLKNHYKTYCRILKNVIAEAKKQYYSKQILFSHNEMKTIWDITKSVTGKLNFE